MEESKVVENQTAPEQGQAGKADVQNASGPAQAVDTTTPAQKVDQTAQPEFDLRKSYEELRKEFTRATQERSTYRKEAEMTRTELQALKKAQADLSQMLSKATEKQISPEEFLRDLQAHGPKALDSYLDKKVKSVEEAYNKKLSEQSSQYYALESEIERMRRESDHENYPDFKKLFPVMAEMAQSGDYPVDFNQPTGKIYDALYALARAQHSEEALKQAEQIGRQQAEAGLVKESQATVTGGGKTGSSANPADIKDIKKLRDFFVQQLGESE